MEAELTAKAAEENTGDNSTGQRTVDDAFSHRLDRQNSVFETRQGFRRRHPHEVLNRFAGLVTTTDTTSTVVEAAMEHEHERAEIDKELQPSDISTGLSTMYHIEDVARKNYRQSKHKLRNMHLVGI